MNSSWFSLNQLNIGEPAHNSGHVVYPHARVVGNPNYRVIYKLNKKDQAIYSIYEAALSAVSEVFLEPFLTSPVRLVKNEHNNIVGVASKHMYYQACQRHPQQGFSVINNQHALSPADHPQDNSDEKFPIYFLDTFPNGFFAGLYARHQDPYNSLFIDMRSLASVLTSAQTLEEDDLHKGNLGFYIVKETNGSNLNKNQRIVFFKIDHDLMMANHLMSFFDPRPQNFFYNERAFAETRTKLEHFPGPDESAHHTVAKTPLIAKPFDSKVHSSSIDIKAFRSLASDKDFIQHKWEQKLKHILVDESILREHLETVLSTEIPEEKSSMDITINAVMERLAHSKAVLLSVPEFRQYILSLDHQTIPDIPELDEEEQGMGSEMSSNILTLQTIARECKKGDTALHCAIRLGEFRFDESLKFFAQDLNQVNADGDTPLDLAIRRAGTNWYKPKQDDNPGADGFYIANYLLEAGARGRMTSTERRLLSEDSGQSSYLQKVAPDCSIQTILADLGLDNRLTLKMKKDIALQCLQEFIKIEPNNKETLEALRESLNGRNQTRPDPQFDYIRQFRSSLWIIRWFRSGFGKHCGLFGETATCRAMNRMINTVLNNSSVKSGFFGVKSEPDADNGPQPDGPVVNP